MIIANKEAAIQKAIFNVLPECDSFSIMELKNNVLTEKSILDDGKEEEDKSRQFIYAGYDSENELIGFAIPGDQAGFQDIISAMFGYDAVQQTIIGFEVLESKETPGLGDKIFKDAEFKNNFIRLETKPEVLFAKKGEKVKENEVEGITGATISSKAVVELLKNNLNMWQSRIDDYMESKEKNTKKINE
ncbi:MAG: FMN-binding protein [Saprospiraceae bacterium]|nr:FMN-binding protein [Saprospiraceae bacterium]